MESRYIVAKTLRKFSRGGGIVYFISPASPLKYEIQEELIKSGFANETEILNYELAHKYISCQELEKSVVLCNTGIVPCCFEPGKNPMEAVRWNLNNPKETIQNYILKRDEIIHKLSIGERTSCDGCSALRKDYWRDEKKIRSINIGLSFPCQLSCCYCTWMCNAKNLTKDNKLCVDNAEQVDIPRIIEEMEKEGVISSDTLIGIASGEITIAKNREKILNACRKYPMMILSNGIIYSSEVAAILSSDIRSRLNVSIDAGTRETYAKVKGLDAFESVKETLYKYHRAGVKIELKYIILNQNNNEQDLDGFIEIAKEIEPEKIIVSFDFATKQENISKEILNSARRLADASKNLNIDFELVPAFGRKNIAYIMKGET